jgi:HlyD family secretion protein
MYESLISEPVEEFMKSTLKPIFIILALILVTASAGCGTLQGNSSGTSLQASGVIEATEIAIAPEISGRVVEVKVKEGDAVQAGAELFHLDDTLLQTQKQAASASLESAKAGVQTAQAGLAAAQAQYDLTLSNALAEAQDSRISTWDQSKPSEFDQPTWYFSQNERLKSAQSDVETAKQALADKQAKLDTMQKKAASADFLSAETKLSDARLAYQNAKDVLDRTSGTSDGQDLRDAAQTAFDDAKADLSDAQKAYDDALTTDGAKDVLQARAEVAVALERYNTAMDTLRSLQTGADSPIVVAAAKTVDQAKAALEQSQAAIQEAQANLDAINAQIGKLTVSAPTDGVVLVSSIQPGEVLQAGMTALTIGKLDQLKVTVYLPEDRYGEVSLGDEASLSVDSFPGVTFKATVTRIANQAEYTPRNVQTKEERQTTVYAVELSIANPDGKLIPGMPVDVTFAAKSGK